MDEIETQESRFLVNVIRCHHRRPAMKIKGLTNLLMAGHTVRTAQFDLDALVIDGCKASWCVLDEWAHRTK